ncbi:TrmH family RNA methyltransferase [Arcanobacterium buesumense]|uniref:RNA methyltransferase n=1 Tax=Arcanobacterium buesumense TaxID=2722751 RepID=A0A6H2EJW9_9ACTO|nr:RNA methyltransferase [Arcanobacterium buesumense]QJC21868.1 RNA methyltransferase [Arcanobacterium buesumense]
MPRTPMETYTGQLKKVAGLYRSKTRLNYAQAIVEGPQSVREALVYLPSAIRDVYITQHAIERHGDIDRLLLDLDPYTHILPDELSNRIAPNAQGIFAVISVPDEERFDSVVERGKLLVCAIRSVDPGNLGTIIRSADAAGADAVILGRGSVDATNPKVIRSSAGSYFHIPIIEDEDVASVVERVQRAGFQILAADGGGTHDLGQLSDKALRATLLGEALAEVDLRRPTLWLVGNEAHGFSQEELSWADGIVRIPMWGKSESLNAAVATSLCLYASAHAHNRTIS